MTEVFLSTSERPGNMDALALNRSQNLPSIFTIHKHSVTWRFKSTVSCVPLM